MIKFSTQRIRAIVTALIFIAIMLLLHSCNLFEKPEKDTSSNDYIYETFNKVYLWYNEIPEIEPNDYETNDLLLNAIKVEKDRYSFIGSLEFYKNFLEAGESTSFGAEFVIDIDNQIKTKIVYSNSPMGRNGVERGWILQTVNGYDISNLDKVNEALNAEGLTDFVFVDFDGIKHAFSEQREVIVNDGVIHSSIYEIENHKIGYFVYDSFIKNSEVKLEEIFAKFQSENITDIVVDFRYNGGGYTDIAYSLTGMLGGDAVKGNVIAYEIFNDKLSDRNNTQISEYNGPSINVDRIHFITTENSASSSEVVINSLQPYKEVTLIGSKTYGKPYGMYFIDIEEFDLAIFPVSLKTTNSEGFGDYSDGISVNIQENDDFSHNWGDPEELMFKAAINSILDETFALSSRIKSMNINNQRPLQARKRIPLSIYK
ncbi:MAG: S41 family peptidase [Prolixibacteraceae bacterium]|jgi:carboxyl-terminal processing protease|nr:S41 family peptidase [Prolixibacteraceae bacterium]